jgi:hypothetical protein
MPTAMMVRFKVTFEYKRRSPTTHEGVVAGSSAAICTRRAVLEAQRALRPRNWVAVSCLLQDRTHPIAQRTFAESDAGLDNGPVRDEVAP